MKLYRKLNVYESGSITIKGTRKKLYNYIKFDCKDNNIIKEYLLTHKDSTVFTMHHSMHPN